jgi:1-acyl-sn-glycerol-3-phosphate acyltransferase
MPSTIELHAAENLAAIAKIPADIQLTAAWIWLGCLLLISLVYAAGLFMKSDYGPWEKCLYLPTYLLGRVLWRVHFTNQPPPQLSSGAILVANHRSSVDPFFVQLAARRRVHWMVAQEFCQHFLFGPLLRQLQVIPTRRAGTDTASTRRAIQITSQGRLVGMFPEGRINTTSQLLLPLRSGAALVSARSQSPLIPLLIEGSPYRSPQVWSPVFMPAHVRITFGNPIAPAGINGHQNSKLDQADAVDIGSELQHPARAEEGSGRYQPHQLDNIMEAWGREIARLAGKLDFEVQLASARSRKRKQSVDETTD